MVNNLVIIALSLLSIHALMKGCPKIVRADKGTENAKVSFLHPFLRHQSTNGANNSAENTFRYGRSVNNQVRYFEL